MLDAGQNPFYSLKNFMGLQGKKMEPEFCQMSGEAHTKYKDGLCRMRFYFSCGPVLCPG